MSRRRSVAGSTYRLAITSSTHKLGNGSQLDTRLSRPEISAAAHIRIMILDVLSNGSLRLAEGSLCVLDGNFDDFIWKRWCSGVVVFLERRISTKVLGTVIFLITIILIFFQLDLRIYMEL